MQLCMQSASAGCAPQPLILYVTIDFRINTAPSQILSRCLIPPLNGKPPHSGSMQARAADRQTQAAPICEEEEDEEERTKSDEHQWVISLAVLDVCCNEATTG